MKKATGKRTLSWISMVAGWKKIYMVFLLAMQVALAVSGIGYAVIFRGLTDEAVAGNRSRFFQWIALFIGVVIFQIVISACNRFLCEYSKSTMENCFKERLLANLLERNYAKVTSVHSGEWMNRLTSDTVVVAEGLTQIIPEVTGMVVRLTGALILLIVMYPLFGWILIPGGLVLTVMNYVFRKQLKRMHKKVQEADGNLRVFLQESLSSMMIVRSFARERQILKKADEKMDAHKEMRMKRNHFSNVCNIGFTAIMNGAYILGAGVGGYGILTGTMSYGTLMAIIQLIGQIQSPFANITGYLPRYYAMLASAERLMEVESYDTDVLAGEQKMLDEVLDFYQKHFKSLDLIDVDFAYQRSQESERMQVLKHVNLEIRKGSCVAFTGHSGCGKSTLLKLLLCLYSLDAGRILLTTQDDSVPLSAKWRRLFAYVPQGNQLMSGTIREIVTFRMDENIEEDERIYHALQMADAEQFVRNLPMGIDTVLGEHGKGLSEGQMQRIAIARAIYADNPILILDESTSALDEETEKHVLMNLKKMTDKTVLIVTHRKAVLDICDIEVHFSEDGVAAKKRNHRKGTTEDAANRE